MSIRSNYEWHGRATARAMQEVRKVLADLPSGMTVSRLSDHELGWLVSAALFGWIAARAEEAATEGLDAERIIRMTGQAPDPWNIGAIEAILPELAGAKVDWSKPLAAWSRGEIVSFVSKAANLVNEAISARDRRDGTIVRKANAAEGLGVLGIADEPADHMITDLEEPRLTKRRRSPHKRTSKANQE